MKATIKLTHDSQIEHIIADLREALKIAPHDLIIKKSVKQRSLLQNKSLHLYCKIMAEKLNDAGIDQRDLVGRFKDGFEIPTSGSMIKDIIRAVGLAMFKRESTADLTTTEMISVYKSVDERFGIVTGCRAEWPQNKVPTPEEST